MKTNQSLGLVKEKIKLMNSKLKDLILFLKNKHPSIGKIVILAARVAFRINFTIETCSNKLANSKEYGLLNFNKIYYIRPKTIKFYVSSQLYFKWKSSQRIMDGNWDKTKKKIENLPIYKACKEKFEEGKEWKETEYYKLQKTNYLDVFEQNVARIEFLYNKIKEEGYKSQKELKKTANLFNFPKWKPIIDEVSVGISRDGNFLFINGRHRLAIAKILDLPKIPVVVLIRHKKWMEFKKRLIYFSKNYRNKKLYQKTTHPDLQEIPFERGDFRFNEIRKNLSVSCGKLLDIGSNLGYFCHKFEDEGFDCYAVETNKFYAYFLKKLKMAENKKFKVIQKSIFNYKKDQILCFDVVLALNIFHHFLKRKKTYNNLINLLKRLKTKELYLGTHKPTELKDMNPYKNYKPQEFADFVVKNSCLNKSTFLAKTNDGRSIFKITT